jgi:membrane glycosyltransferase
VTEKLYAAAARVGAPAAPLQHEAETAARVFEVPAAKLLQDWKQAHARTLAYVDALGIPPDDRESLAAEAIARALGAQPWEPGSNAVAETLRALRRLLLERYPTARRPAAPLTDEFLAWRLDAALSGRFAAQGSAAPATLPQRSSGVPSSMPELNRGPMVPSFEPRGLRRWFRSGRQRHKRATARLADAQGEHSAMSRRRNYPWVRVAHRRRALLLFLVLIPSVIASGFMVDVLPHQGRTWLEFAIVLFFGALFGWISIGFWTALLGFFTLVGRADRFVITHLDRNDTSEFAPGGRTAVVMPICEEPVDRVFAGLRAIYQSLERVGAVQHFDFFVLSDSSDPGTWVKEEEAWLDWCRSLNRFDKIFYRRRRVRLKRKSGNVADFCRRWGKQYRYMIMLDADSVMAGETLVALVRLMERHPDAGMIQTAPSAVNRRSLFARVQQFASRVYGPMFAAGLHFWQLGDGQYWGHNTVIRVAPFMALCGLPRLPGRPPLGGEIMSHDFVEAALMGRAGWALWLAFDLPGSYEETPSTLLEEMKRDRRWCQGNLQHLRILPTEGLFGAHRALFINGVMSYVSALLWFCFLTLSTAEAIRDVLVEPDYFPSGASLFPEWPVWRPNWALSLLAVTAMILFLPKILSVVTLVAQRQAPAYGGGVKLTLSVLLEILLSSLFAPIRMLFHSKFVVQNLLGRTVSWRSQTREDAETGWWEAIRHHGLDTLFATAWGVSLFWLNPRYFWWVTPIIAGLISSIPISVLASRIRIGDRARAWGLFQIPEEGAPPAELRDLDRNLRVAQNKTALVPAAERDGFVRVIVDPYVNALHRALRGQSRSVKATVRTARSALLERVLADGPGALAARERRILLSDPDLVDQLHQRVWESPAPPETWAKGACRSEK